MNNDNTPKMNGADGDASEAIWNEQSNEASQSRPGDKAARLQEIGKAIAGFVMTTVALFGAAILFRKRGK